MIKNLRCLKTVVFSAFSTLLFGRFKSCSYLLLLLLVVALEIILLLLNMQLVGNE